MPEILPLAMVLDFSAIEDKVIKTSVKEVVVRDIIPDYVRAAQQANGSDCIGYKDVYNAVRREAQELDGKGQIPELQIMLMNRLEPYIKKVWPE
jgi:hypothetical protein